jgi:hypothetical protein
MLKLRLSDSSRIAVEVDGRYIDRQTSSLTLDGLPQGPHHIKVYGIDGSGKRRMRLYTGTIRVKPGSVNFGVVDVYRHSLGVHSRARNAEDDRGHARGNNHGQEEHQSRDNHAPVQQGEVHPEKDEPKTDEGSTNNEPETAPVGQSTENGTPTSVMNELYAKVESHPGDTEKEALMKKELENRRFSTEQLRQMLGWLVFESTKLSFAQWSYSRLGDQYRYSELEDVFESDASRKEFQKTARGDR